MKQNKWLEERIKKAKARWNSFPKWMRDAKDPNEPYLTPLKRKQS